MPKRFLWALLALATNACTADDPVTSGPVKCPAPASGAVSYGCALLTGIVVGPADEPLAGISGAVRATDACGCPNVAIPVDSTGRFSITLQRSLQRPTTTPDTATIVIYAGATDGRYPRSVTGDPFFDTASVRLMFSPVGAVAAQFDLRLRIPLPPS
ncbi:MAG: hypothetical protein ABI877_12435 [Gemmatimonadaceae bacterium]